jgi:hypothetical protein
MTSPASRPRITYASDTIFIYISTRFFFFFFFFLNLFVRSDYALEASLSRRANLLGIKFCIANVTVNTVINALSAIGSIILPTIVLRLYFRAICPSN